MKFIFPQNYRFNFKILGIMDYQTAIFNSINVKIFLFIMLCFPMIIFSIIGVNGDSLISVLIYMSKFIIKPKLLFYSK